MNNRAKLREIQIASQKGTFPMNLVSELQKDQSLRDDMMFESFKLVSLLDMLRFYADRYLRSIACLSELAQMFNNAPDSSTLIKWLRQCEPQLRWLHQDLTAMDLVDAAESVESLLWELQDHSGPGKWSGEPEPGKCLRPLIKSVIAGFKKEYVLRVPRSRALSFKKKGTILGEKVIHAFPVLERDAVEAGNCFALGRYTGCAFHLMRIMECIVRRFAENLGVTINADEDTWGTILDHIWDQKINRWPKSPTKRKYTACWRSIDGLRQRRNDIMHHKEYYTEEDVDDLKGRVKSCISDFLKLPEPLII